jgi:hypothetical protein
LFSLLFCAVTVDTPQQLVALLSARKIGEIDFSPSFVVYTDDKHVLLLPKLHCFTELRLLRVFITKKNLKKHVRTTLT